MLHHGAHVERFRALFGGRGLAGTPCKREQRGKRQKTKTGGQGKRGGHDNPVWLGSGR
ncbi:hypothetical protein BN126_4073 [Cronobacter sakazakii 680]|nr:hypothetical protein BN126_4073 [Cronobacter sakazakii 680]